MRKTLTMAQDLKDTQIMSFRRLDRWEKASSFELAYCTCCFIRWFGCLRQVRKSQKEEKILRLFDVCKQETREKRRRQVKFNFHLLDARKWGVKIVTCDGSTSDFWQLAKIILVRLHDAFWDPSFLLDCQKLTHSKGINLNVDDSRWEESKSWPTFCQWSERWKIHFLLFLSVSHSVSP